MHTNGPKAVVLWFQAALYDTRNSNGRLQEATSDHTSIIDAIARGARAFGKPVLVMHGDHHRLELAGFQDTKLKVVPNTFRLQPWGETEVHAMRVIVDPDMPGVFSFAPLVIPENGAF